MSGVAQPDLSVLAGYVRQLSDGARGLRDDLTALKAAVVRMDHKLSTLLTEVRAMNSQHAGSGDEVRDTRASSV